MTIPYPDQLTFLFLLVLYNSTHDLYVCFIWPSLVLRHGLLLKGSRIEPAAGYDVTTVEPRLMDTPQQQTPTT